MHRMLVCASAMAAAAQAQDAKSEIDESKRRVEDLEKRSAPSGDERVQPCHFTHPAGNDARTSQDPKNFAITGFFLSSPDAGGEVGAAAAGLRPRRDRALHPRRTSIRISAVQLVASLTPENELDVEVGVLPDARAPGRGFTVKGGRFLSAIGYQNRDPPARLGLSRDAPLPYKAFLGGRLQQDGVQLKWVAPTISLELGAEARQRTAVPRIPSRTGTARACGRALRDTSAATSPGRATRGARASRICSTSATRTARSATSIRAALPSPTASAATANLWIVRWGAKWAPNGNRPYTTSSCRPSTSGAREDGNLAYDRSGAARPADYASQQSAGTCRPSISSCRAWRVG